MWRLYLLWRGAGIGTVLGEAECRKWRNCKKLPVIPAITDGNGNYSIAGATYGVFLIKDCTKQLATLTTDETGNTDTVEVKAGTVYIKELMRTSRI